MYSSDTSSFTLSRGLVLPLWSLILISLPGTSAVYNPYSVSYVGPLVEHTPHWVLCRWLAGDNQRILIPYFIMVNFSQNINTYLLSILFEVKKSICLCLICWLPTVREPFPLIRDSIFSHCLGPLYQIPITLSSLFLLYLLFFSFWPSNVAVVHCMVLPHSYQPVQKSSLFSCFTRSVAPHGRPSRVDLSTLTFIPHSSSLSSSSSPPLAGHFL